MIARGSLVLAGFAAALAFAGLALPGAGLAQDIRHMCSEKYQAAKAAGTLGGETWPQFYSRCTAELKANPPGGATSAPAAEAPPPLDVRHICSQKYQAAKAAGTLGGESWPQFYSRCTAEVKANPAAAAAPPVAAAPPPEKAPEAPPPVAETQPEETPAAAAPSIAETPPPPPPAVAQAPPPAPAAPPPPAPVNPLKKSAPPTAAAPATPGTTVFPTAIAPEFASEKPARARMKTCQKQYNANKAANANGGLKWIQKGDGYWPECNKRLKG